MTKYNSRNKVKLSSSDWALQISEGQVIIEVLVRLREQRRPDGPQGAEGVDLPDGGRGGSPGAGRGRGALDGDHQHSFLTI